MNKKANISIRTPMGPTEKIPVDSIVKQGSVLSSLLCSASTGEYLDEKPDGGLQVGMMNVGGLAFVDEVSNINTNTDDVHTTHDSLIWFATKKKLQLSPGKCFILPINMKPNNAIPNLRPRSTNKRHSSILR